MPRDRPGGRSLIADDVKELLNSRQVESLDRSHDFGWRVAFVRKPLLNEPVVIVYNSRHHLIGLLDQDGQINTEVDVEIRSADSPHHPIHFAYWTKEHKGTQPTRSKIDLLLNDKQLKALARIEKFGWQLNFVRKPLRQQPVAVIISPKNNKLATLELDGRIKLLPRSNARSEMSADPRRYDATARRSMDEPGG
jgi:hypothetical protein